MVFKEKALPMATIKRMPNYLRYLKNKEKDGYKSISSVTIAEDMRLNAVVVKKDLALASSEGGKPKIGFNLKTLIIDVERFLGYDLCLDAILVGAGNLGSTLLTYDGFYNYGLNIIAAFDSDNLKVGTTIAGKDVLDMSELNAFVKDKNVRVGIITVRKESGQEVAEKLVLAGIEAIWNFAPVNLILPPKTTIKNEDLAASLAVLATGIKRREPIEE